MFERDRWHAGPDRRSTGSDGGFFETHPTASPEPNGPRNDVWLSGCRVALTRPCGAARADATPCASIRWPLNFRALYPQPSGGVELSKVGKFANGRFKQLRDSTQSAVSAEEAKLIADAKKLAIQKGSLAPAQFQQRQQQIADRYTGLRARAAQDSRDMEATRQRHCDACIQGRRNRSSWRSISRAIAVSCSVVRRF